MLSAPHQLGLGLWLAATLATSVAANPDFDYFESAVAPLLEARCFECHSHAAGKMKAGLTLDSRAGWERGGENGPAVVPGKPDDSLLIRAVRRSDPDLEMPPKMALTADEIAILVEWVRRGAPDPRLTEPVRDFAALTRDWWSLRPLVRPPLPGSPDATGHPIDRFIRDRLQASGLSPSPAADRSTLIRRLYFDLHGLPPTPEQVSSFVADPDPQAYVHLVDALLDSPRYGERWARHWLDTIHFADSHGCEHDVKRDNAWRFRDYVIARLNQDAPWGRLIREQLAADVFFPDESPLIAGLGFIAAGPYEQSRASTAPVTFAYLDRDDMVTQTMAAFASTTVNCARCHDHKFDPVTQEDYYSLQAVFAGVGKADVEFDPDPAVLRRRSELLALQAAAAERNAEVLLAPDHAEVVASWVRAHEGMPATWTPLMAEALASAAGSEFQPLDDGSYRPSGPRPETDTYTLTAVPPLKALNAIRLDVLADDTLPMKGPGRQDNGNLHLSEFEAQLIRPGDTAPQRLKIRQATADWDQEGWTIAHTLDGDPKTAWGIYPKVGESHHAVFELETPIDLPPGSRLSVALTQIHGGGHLIGRFRLSVTDSPNPSQEILPAPVQSALSSPASSRSADQQLTLAAFALGLHARDELAKSPPRPAVYAVTSSAPQTVHVLHRGDIAQPGPVAAPGALSAIATLPGRFDLAQPENEASRRAALAEWLAAAENPLTWRSAANRVWHYHFGRGLCDTPNDFGRMGGVPSHPELLDWLAHWFRDDASGSLKQLHRLIVTSETYRQSSAVTADNRAALAVDAEDRLLWRMTARRLDADAFRDAVLQISGRLDLAMGGPGIEQFAKHKGPQATPSLDYSAYDWNQPGAARRSIYRVVWRGIADPFMDALDFPDLALLSPTRGASVSALQALTLFNNDFVLHHSAELAARLAAGDAPLEDQVRRACQLVLLRDPGEAELGELVSYARQFGVPALARVLFNSNGFLFVD